MADDSPAMAKNSFSIPKADCQYSRLFKFKPSPVDESCAFDHCTVLIRACPVVSVPDGLEDRPASEADRLLFRGATAL
jgi:hypothetical protein